MAKETLREENKRLTQELKEARAQIDLLTQEVLKLNNETNAAYENSSFYKADQACMRDLKNQIETLKSQLSHTRKEREKASEEIRLLNLERDVAVENMAYTHDEAHKDLIDRKMLAYELEAAQSDCRRLKNANKQLQEDKEVLQQKVKDLEHSVEERSENLKNPFGAGRKKNDRAYQKRYEEFADLVRKGNNMTEIMEQMEISRSTYFRFLKVFKEK